VAPAVAGIWQHNYSTKTRHAGWANEQSMYSLISMDATIKVGASSLRHHRIITKKMIFCCSTTFSAFLLFSSPPGLSGSLFVGAPCVLRSRKFRGLPERNRSNSVSVFLIREPAGRSFWPEVEADCTVAETEIAGSQKSVSGLMIREWSRTRFPGSLQKKGLFSFKNWMKGGRWASVLN